MDISNVIWIRIIGFSCQQDVQKIKQSILDLIESPSDLIKGTDHVQIFQYPGEKPCMKIMHWQPLDLEGLRTFFEKLNKGLVTPLTNDDITVIRVETSKFELKIVEQQASGF